jgi:HAD superfamily hydrolase (TIGR01509 family)
MFKAVIFDMNGVIISDELVHHEAMRQYCKKHGLKIKEDELESKVFGRTEKDIFEYIYGRPIMPEELEKYSNERVDNAIAIYKPHLKLNAGLDILLKDLHDNNIPMAVATNARNRYFNFIMGGLGIRKYFKVAVTAQDIIKGKPDPEIYLKAAKLLEVSPSDCLVFEDTATGIKSAKAADMKVIAITTTYSKKELSQADKIIDSFNEIGIECLRGEF